MCSLVGDLDPRASEALAREQNCQSVCQVEKSQSLTNVCLPQYLWHSNHLPFAAIRTPSTPCFINCCTFTTGTKGSMKGRRLAASIRRSTKCPPSRSSKFVSERWRHFHGSKRAPLRVPTCNQVSLRTVQPSPRRRVGIGSPPPPRPTRAAPRPWPTS